MAKVGAAADSSSISPKHGSDIVHMPVCMMPTTMEGRPDMPSLCCLCVCVGWGG